VRSVVNESRIGCQGSAEVDILTAYQFPGVRAKSGNRRGNCRQMPADSRGGMGRMRFPVTGRWFASVLLALTLGPACAPTLPDQPLPSGSHQLFVLPEDSPVAPAPSPALALLTSAARSIALEMYLLTDDDALDALCAARLAGREVIVILERAPYRADGANQPAYDRLARAGVDVLWANARTPLTHAKLLVVDGRRVAVMTANFTRAGLTSNREYLVVSDDPTDVADAETIIVADRAAADAPAPGGRLVATPGGAREALTALADGARSRLDVQMEELSDAGLVASLGAAVDRGVTVTVVAPARDRSAATTGALGRLAAAGAIVRVLESPTVHAKAMVADQRRFYVGSMNLTVSSLDSNREVGVILDDGAGARRISSVIAQDAARGVAP
jgi:cardiolipin synthase